MDFHFSLQLTGDNALKLPAGHDCSITSLFAAVKAFIWMICLGQDLFFCVTYLV